MSVATFLEETNRLKKQSLDGSGIGEKIMIRTKNWNETGLHGHPCLLNYTPKGCVLVYVQLKGLKLCSLSLQINFRLPLI